MGHQEQLYIEPNGVIAVPGPAAAITVYGSMQCPYYVHRALDGAARAADDKVASSRRRPAAGSAARKSTRR
jgi:xanthine dehydrogenase molybdopterin-binding subunit B